VFFASHAEHFNLVEKKRWLDEAVGANPFIDKGDLLGYIEKNERAFLDQLAKERALVMRVRRTVAEEKSGDSWWWTTPR